MTPPKCHCGIYAIGECVSCEKALCSDHGATFEGGFRCDGHLRAARRAAKVREQVQAEEVEVARALGSDPRVEQFALTSTQLRSFVASGAGAGCVVSWMEAFECGRTAASWARAGLSIETAIAFGDLEIGPAAARRWVEALGEDNVWMVPKLSAAGLTAKAVSEWDPYALDTDGLIEWATSEFHAKAAQKCARREFGPADLRKWLDAGVAIGEVADFLDEGIDLPAAVMWLEARLAWPPGEAAEWRAGRFGYDVARRWRSAGATPSMATDWRAKGFDDVSALEWHVAGFTPTEAKSWEGFALSRAIEHREAGWTAEQIARTW